MSIDAVLDRRPNVRDFEIPEKTVRDPYLVTWPKAQEALKKFTEMTIDGNTATEYPTDKAVDLSFAIYTLFPNLTISSIDRNVLRNFHTLGIEWPTRRRSLFLKTGDAADHAARVSMLSLMGVLDFTEKSFPDKEEAIRIRDVSSITADTELLSLAFGIKNLYPELFNESQNYYGILAKVNEEFFTPFVGPAKAMRKFAFARLMFPDEFKRWEPLKQIDWEKVDFFIGKYKKEGNPDWIELAVYSQIIRADKAELTPNGIIISNEQKPIDVSVPPPLPEVRRFP